MNKQMRNKATSVSRALMLVVLASILTGCDHVRGGYRISPATTAFIQQGATTRAEVIANFGSPTMELHERRVIAYTWQTERGTSSHQAWGLPLGERDETIMGLADWAFCIRFDELDRVLGRETLKSTGTDSISDAVLAWANAKAR